jgi:beta-1,2-mannobiose phosphorylase / 1,2-beta-oligomannan phosphorylase
LTTRIVLIPCILILLTAPLSAQTNWHKHLSNPVLPHWSGDPDQPSSYKHILGPTVVFDENESLYRMWFSSMAFGWGTNFCISEAVSPDGFRWYANLKNPVIRSTPGTFDSRSMYNPSVVRVPTGYYMYYAGYKEERFEIGLATSPDAIRWTKHGATPVLSGGKAGSWDYCVRQMTVHFDGTLYRGLFDGRSNAGVWSIGYATSPDGVHWTKYEKNPVLTGGEAGSFEEAGVGEPTMVFAANKYHLIYTGYALPGLTGRLGYASSNDCISWTRFEGNPVLDHGGSGSWDGGHLAAGSLMFQDSTFRLWYVGGDNPTSGYEIGFASAALREETEEGDARLRPHLSDFSLLATTPTPLNPATRLSYSLPERCNVWLRLYDILGSEVRFLHAGTEGPGIRMIRWNGKTNEGTPTAAGLYLAVLFARGSSGKEYKTCFKVVRTP